MTYGGRGRNKKKPDVATQRARIFPGLGGEVQALGFADPGNVPCK